jgi:hypothetical protein
MEVLGIGMSSQDAHYLEDAPSEMKRASSRKNAHNMFSYNNLLKMP